MTLTMTMTMSTAPGRAALHAALIEKERKTGQSKGVASWLATGLKIEEAQYVKRVCSCMIMY
jgi:hypothetical protein